MKIEDAHFLKQKISLNRSIC